MTRMNSAQCDRKPNAKQNMELTIKHTQFVTIRSMQKKSVKGRNESQFRIYSWLQFCLLRKLVRSESTPNIYLKIFKNVINFFQNLKRFIFIQQSKKLRFGISLTGHTFHAAHFKMSQMASRFKNSSMIE